MADGPTHYVIIETADGKELRRLGPMHLGRANAVKRSLDNDPPRLGDGNTARIADNPNWDFENNREKANADTDETTERAPDDRRRDHGDGHRNQGQSGSTGG